MRAPAAWNEEMQPRGADVQVAFACLLYVGQLHLHADGGLRVLELIRWFAHGSPHGALLASTTKGLGLDEWLPPTTLSSTPIDAEDQEGARRGEDVTAAANRSLT